MIKFPINLPYIATRNHILKTLIWFSSQINLSNSFGLNYVLAHTLRFASRCYKEGQSNVRLSLPNRSQAPNDTSSGRGLGYIILLSVLCQKMSWTSLTYQSDLKKFRTYVSLQFFALGRGLFGLVIANVRDRSQYGNIIAVTVLVSQKFQQDFLKTIKTSVSVNKMSLQGISKLR